MKADERSRTEASESEVKDEVKVKDVNMQEAQHASGAELMQIRVENIKNNQEKGAPFLISTCFNVVSLLA